MRLPVLLYHHVGPQQFGTLPELTVSPERFDSHVRWLARRGYVGVGASDWVSWCRDRTPLPAKPVLLTFDDAYTDVATYALPVLRRHSFGGVVFVVTAEIGGENRWDQARGSAPHRLMTADQIRAWARCGIEFGAHSRTHADLTTLRSGRLDDEIRGSRDDLTAITGSPVRSFAYPYGRFDSVVHRHVCQYFDAAFTCRGGVNAISTDRHALRRSMVQPNDSVVALTCRVRLGRYPAHDWRARLRLRSRLREAAGCFFGAQG